MNMNDLMEKGRIEQTRRELREAHGNSINALAAVAELDEKIKKLSRQPMTKAQGVDPSEVSRLKTQIRNLEARLAKLEPKVTNHTTRLDKHLTRQKAHAARLGQLESQVLEPMAKAAQAKEAALLAKGEKRLERMILEHQSEELLVKADSLMSAVPYDAVRGLIHAGELEEAQRRVANAEREAREIAEAKAYAVALTFG